MLKYEDLYIHNNAHTHTYTQRGDRDEVTRHKHDEGLSDG